MSNGGSIEVVNPDVGIIVSPAQGPPGVRGSSILNGARDPFNSDGLDGDWWINTATAFIAGPKAGGFWPVGISMVGPPGPTGNVGATGATGTQGQQGPPGPGASVLSGAGPPTTATGMSGDFYIDIASVAYNIYGPKTTSWPPPYALAGPTGPAGPQGAQGVAGPTGPTGPQGSAGPPGITGAPGATGPTGAQGPQGIQGPTGAAGATGQGVPVGGAAGTVLQKNSATNYDTIWATAGATGVSSWNTRTGAVTLTLADVTGVGGAPLASPALTGTPTAPTATQSTSTTQLATTSFVVGQASSSNPAMNGVAAPGIATTFSRWDHVHPSDTSMLPLTGGMLTGSISIDGASGTARRISGTTGGVKRWEIDLGDSTAEGGSSTGSNFAVVGYNDAGTVINSPITIPRVTGRVSVANGLTVAAGSIIINNAVNGFLVGPGSVGAINNQSGANISTAGSVFESSATAIFANKIGANGTAISMMQGGVSCGSITVANQNQTIYNTSSDIRLKSDAQPFDAGPILDATQVYYFKWTNSGTWSYGVMAQEAVEVFPDAVTHDEQLDHWGVDYSKYVPLLLNEIKALRASVAALKARVGMA
jgi:hypothetical protein